MSDFTERLMKRARELDGATPSSSSGTISSANNTRVTTNTTPTSSFSERLMQRAREIDSAPTYKWQGFEAAENDLNTWGEELNTMSSHLNDQRKIISGYETRLQELQSGPQNNSTRYRYNAMKSQYDKAIESYNELVGKYNTEYEQYQAGLEAYRNNAGREQLTANTLNTRISELQARNEEIKNEINNENLTAISTPDAYLRELALANVKKLEAERSQNNKLIEQYSGEADTALSRYYGSFQLMDDFGDKSGALDIAAAADIAPDNNSLLLYESVNKLGPISEHSGYTPEGNRWDSYAQMTPEEVSTYNYIFSTQGAEAADEFIKYIQNSLNARQGQENYENMSTLGKALYWIPAGLDQFSSGIQQLFQDEAVPTSAKQYTSQLIRDEANETSSILGALYDVGTSISNMAPSLLVSALTGGAGAPAAVAGAIGSTVLGASAGGNAYTQKINEGYSPEAASTYATLVGAAEGGLQYLLGGIGKLSSGATSRIAAKIAGLDNALGRVARTVTGSTAGRLAGSMISEGTEEGLQELLEPAFATLVLGEEYDANFEDAAYAFLLGALSAGIIEGSMTAVNGRRTAFTFHDLDGYATNGVDYFEGINTLGDLEARYRELARQNHPDLGGDTSTLAEINRQHSMARAFLRGQSGGTAERTDSAAGTTDDVAGENLLLNRPQGESTAARQDVTAQLTSAPDIENGIILPTAEELMNETPQFAQQAGTETEQDANRPRKIVLPTADDVDGVILPTAEDMIGGTENVQQEQQRDQISDGNRGRIFGQRAGGQAGQLVEGTGGRATSFEQGRTALERQNSARHLRLEEVSTQSLGVPEGTESPSVRVLPPDAWDEELQRTAEDVYVRTGRDVEFVLGALEVHDSAGGTRRVRGVWRPDGTIIIQADNMRVSAQQIAEHETYHNITAQMPGTDYAVEERIREQYGDEEFERVVEVYIQKLHGIVDLPADASAAEFEQALARVKQEIYADAYAGINAFGAHAERFVDATREVVQERTGATTRETEQATRDRTGPPSERYSYGGVSALRADREALSAAENMESHGVSNETIRQETGWFRGRDGKWRFEIDDSGMRYSRRWDLNYGDPDYWRYRELLDKLERDMLGLGTEPVTDAERAEYAELSPRYRDFYRQPGVRGDGSKASARLSDYLQHDELFRQYPQLRDAELVFDELDDGIVGWFSGNTIILDEKLRNAPEDTLIHEIQHAIQQAEEFASGSTVDYWRWRIEQLGEDARTNVQRRYAADLREEYESVRENYPEFFNAMTQLAEMEPDVPRGEVDWSTLEPLEDDPIEWRRYDAARDALEAQFGEQDVIEFIQLQGRLKRAEAESGRSAFQMYQDTAGEIEARDTEARRTMTPEQRHATPPDLGNEDTVFVDSDEAGWSMGSDTETSSIKEQIENSRDELNAMEPVANAQVPENLTSKNQASRWAANELRRWGGHVDRQGFGSIYFSEKDIDRGVRYADTPAEKAALAVMPQVLKRGIEIGQHNTHKGRTKQTITFAAPVVLNGTRGNMAVVINQRSSRYYAHRIVLPDGNAFTFSEKTDDAVRELSRGVAENGSLARTTSTASENIIRNNGESVNSRYSADEDEPRPVLAKRDLRRRLLDTFSVPVGSRGELGRMIEGFADRLIRNGRYTEQDRSDLFEKLYDAGVMSVAADPYYAEARNALVKRRMYVNNTIKAEFGDDWNSFRKRAFAAGIYLTNDPNDMAPDMWQAELGETLPGLFDSGNLDMRDFMERVVQVAEEGRDEQVSLAEYTQMLANENYVSEDEVLQDLEDRVDWELRTFAEKADLEIRLRGRGGESLTNRERQRLIQQERANYWQLHRQYQQETRERIAEERAKRHASEREAREKIDNIIREERQKYWEKRRDYQQRADQRVRQERERRWAVQAEARQRVDEVEQAERRTYYERLERYKADRRATDARQRERRKQMAERRRETRELKELQQRTLKQIQWLAKNQYRAPEELKQQWDEVLGDLDIFAVSAANEMNYSEKYGATWRDLADMYKKARDTDPNFLPSQELERIVARLDNDKIGDLDIGALQDLYKAAVGLRTEFYNRNHVLGDEEGRLFNELYQDSKVELNSAPGGYSSNPADKLFNMEQLTPVNYLEYMTGWNPDASWTSMAKQLETGERNERAYVVQANKLLADWLQDNQDWVMRSDGQGKDAIWYEVKVPELLELGMGDKPVFGDSVKVYMTPSMKVHLYLESKNYDNLRHMVGGRTFADKELYSEGKRSEAYAQGRTIRLAPETVRHLVEDLTPEEHELASILERYYNQFAAERINKVSNVLYGYDRAVTKNYAPIYTNSNYNQKELGKFDQTAEGVGNMKQRIRGAKNPSYNMSAYEAFERHVDQTARFVGMAIPARNWKTLLNWREKNDSMSDVITHKWGSDSLRYITDLITDLQGGTPRKAQYQISSAADKLWSNYISAVFGANPSIIIKQLGSIPLGGTYLGMGNVPRPRQVANIDRDLISKYTSELDWRLMGYATPETRQLKDHPNWTQRNSFFRNVFGGGAITGMDGWAASTLWPWAENKVRREQPELEVGTQEQIEAGESPFYKAVAAEFDNAVNRSQSMSDTMHNARIRKSDNLILRTFTMFKSDAAQTYNAFRQTIGEAQYYKRIKASNNTQRAARVAVGTVFAAWILNAAWAAGVNFLVNMAKRQGDSYRDDEDELTAQSVFSKMAYDTIGGLSGVVLLGEELVDAIGSIITGERWYGMEAPGIEQINDTIEGIINGGNSIKDFVEEAVNIGRQGGDVLAYLGEHKSGIIGGIKELAATVLTYLPGLPINNVEAYITGALAWFLPELATAYEDIFETPTKSGLDGLEGDALTTRVSDILSRRLNNVSEETAQTLATLYAADYTSVLPPNIPTQTTVKDEDGKAIGTVELDAYMQQFYGDVWTETVGEAINELVTMPEFETAEPEDQEKMLRRIYDYADEMAKMEVVEGYRPTKTALGVAEEIASGGSLSEWAAYDVLSADVSGTFDRLTDEGLGYEQALDVAEAIDDLGEDASSTEKYMAVAQLPISELEKELALEGIMSDSAYAKYSTAREAGIDTYEYCSFLDTIDGYSGDGRQEQVWAYIDSLPLTSEQKDALHLAAGYKDTTLSKTPWHR